MESNHNEHICIIGGGPGGISAAWFLMENGYHNVTVLEKNSPVGGKCLTVEMADSTSSTNKRKFQLGAEYITFAYDKIFKFCMEVGEETVPAGDILAITGNINLAPPEDLPGSDPDKFMEATLRYMKLVWTYRKQINCASNVGLHQYPELLMSSKEIIRLYNLHPLRGILLVEQFGYGELTELPAIQMFRALPFATLFRIFGEEIGLGNMFSKPIASLAVDGTQGLFTKMAAQLNERKHAVYQAPAVMLNQEVTSIERNVNGANFSLTTSNGQFLVDKVISTIAPCFLPNLMEMSVEDGSLLEKFRFNPYHVGMLEFDHAVPKYYYQNLEMQDKEPVQFSKRYEETKLIAYGYNCKTAPGTQDPNQADEIDTVLDAYVKDSFNVETFVKQSEKCYWDTYYPHVPLEEFSNGFYDRMDELQGKDGLFFAGGGMAAESMEYTCRFSEELVQRFFPADVKKNNTLGAKNEKVVN